MRTMTIIDENGRFKLLPGTLKTVEGDNPAYRARIALALSKGSWMFAPAEGHNLDQYARAKATDQNKLAFQKEAELYLRPYGPEVVARLSSRGTLILEETVTKESISG